MEAPVTMHLITQDNQPIGSRRKCCEECGLYEDNCDKYVTNRKYFTKKYAEQFNLTRCVDKD